MWTLARRWRHVIAGRPPIAALAQGYGRPGVSEHKGTASATSSGLGRSSPRVRCRFMRGEASRPADSCRRRGASAVLTGPEGSRRGPHGETPGSGAGRGCAQLPGGWTEESRPWARRWLSPPPLRTPTLRVSVLDFTLLMKTPRPREVEQLAQGHTAGPRCGQDVTASAKAAAAENPSALWPEACHLQRRWLWCPGRLRALKPRRFPGR